jgi:hypothetical protein
VRQTSHLPDAVFEENRIGAGVDAQLFQQPVKYYKQKYNQNDISLIKRSLVYFDDITDSNWASVRLLEGKVSVKNIKSRIITEMNKYNENIIKRK